MAVVLLIGGILLVGGWAAACLAAPSRPPVPPPDWFADPASGFGERFWDGHAWTPHARESAVTANLGKRFRGGFWGSWAWVALATLAVLALGCIAFYATGVVAVMALTSFLAMTGICWAFYRFAARRLGLHDVIGTLELVFVTAATAGAVILIASNINAVIIDGLGIQAGLATVGFIEEGTKLLVPLTLLAFGRYADPRAGIAIALASGFSFAIIEATQYAVSNAGSSGPSLCGGSLPPPTVESVIQAQVYRIFLVEPLHWLWTGFAAAIAWRLWHLYGRKGNPGAIGAILLVMVIHSLNDSSAGLGCDNVSVAFLAQVFRWGLVIAVYLIFKAAARKSTPPQLIGVVSKGWTPHRLRTYTRERAFVDEE